MRGGFPDTRRPAGGDSVLRAADFIEASIGRPISLRDVAAQSEWSVSHFHRAFRARVGLPVMDYIRRRRLTIAARRLIESDAPIIEIALDAGFNSQAAFTRAFGRVFRRSPAAYRECGRDVTWLSVTALAAETLATLPGLGVESPRCAVVPSIQLAGLETTITARERDTIPALWRELAAILRAIYPRTPIGYGLASAVPRAAEGLLTYAATVAMDGPNPVARGLVTRHVPGGRYLVFPFRGPRRGLPAAIDYLYGTWLPGSGHRLRRAPMLERYRAAWQAGESAAVELWLPIERCA